VTSTASLTNALSADPFGPEALEDPNEFHTAMRDAGPVVYLDRYDLYAMGRYEQVRAALVDWQGFQSGAGVGLVNYRQDPRPPRGPLETDPPRHDALRVVLEAILNVRSLRRLRTQWFADAERLVDEALRQPEFDAVTELTETFPLRVFPDAVGIPDAGRENLLPLEDHLFNSFGPPNDLAAKGAEHAAERAAWISAQCAREALTDHGFGAQVWAAADRGDISTAQAPEGVRAMLSAGVDTPCTGWAPCSTPSPPTPNSGRRCDASRAWLEWPSTKRSVGSHRWRRSSAPRPATSRSGTLASRTARRS